MRGRYVEGTDLLDVYGGYLSSLFEQMVTNLICKQRYNDLTWTNFGNYQEYVSVWHVLQMCGHSLSAWSMLCAEKPQR